jgi:uncharacterized protein YbaA (DUF1428 family)
MAKQKINYVDGFLMVVPQKNLKAYKQMAQKAEKVWRKYGALDYKECLGDDLKTGFGKNYTKILGAKKNELIIFSYITYKSKAHRNQVNAKVMKDPLMNDPKYPDKPMPFDEDRMSYGGFKTIVGA